VFAWISKLDVETTLFAANQATVPVTLAAVLKHKIASAGAKIFDFFIIV
jgi:hypothetical protein